MEEGIKEGIKKEKKMEEVCMCIRMARDMMGSGKMGYSMAKELFVGRMGRGGREGGKWARRLGKIDREEKFLYKIDYYLQLCMYKISDYLFSFFQSIKLYKQLITSNRIKYSPFIFI